MRIGVSADGVPDKLVTEDIKISYDRAISDVPRSILSIPAVGNLLPVAWATDSALNVPDIDRRFSKAVDHIRRAFARQYPTFTTDRKLDAKRTSTNPYTGSGSMLLFSGGVDSLASFIRHEEATPTLTAIHGMDVETDNESAWENVRRSVSDFAERRDVPLRTIRSNCREMLEPPMIHSYYRDEIEGMWWGGVQHGLTLLTLCAPLTHALGIDRLYIASTHSEEYSTAWGSTPATDNEVAWSGTDVVHDGYELTRQDKVERIVDYSESTNEPITIRSCLNSDDGLKCSRCEKCYRTILGIEIAGGDPTNYGYAVTDETFAQARRGLQSGDWNFNNDEQFMWEDLQNALPCDDPAHPSAEPFFAWLEKQDLDELRKHASTSTTTVRPLEPYFKYLPNSVYRILKQGKQTAEKLPR